MKIEGIENLSIGQAFIDFLYIDMNDLISRIEDYIKDIFPFHINDSTSRINEILQNSHIYFKVYENKMNDIMQIHKACIIDKYSEIAPIMLEYENIVCEKIENVLLPIIKTQEIFAALAKDFLDVSNISKSESTLSLLHKFDPELISKVVDLIYHKDIYYTDNGLVRSNSDIELFKSRYKIVKYDEKYSVVTCYQALTVPELIYHEFFFMAKNNLLIKKCCNCGLYFLPTYRSDTEYCDRIIEGSDKTCKEIGPMKAYQEKVKSDPILAEYNRVYQSRYASTVKKHRNNPYKKQKAQKELKVWAGKARIKIIEVKEGKVTFDEYKAWLQEG